MVVNCYGTDHHRYSICISTCSISVYLISLFRYGRGKQVNMHAQALVPFNIILQVGILNMFHGDNQRWIKWLFICTCKSNHVPIQSQNSFGMEREYIFAKNINLLQILIAILRYVDLRLWQYRLYGVRFVERWQRANIPQYDSSKLR